jgi:hypothetical protein
MRGEHPDLPAQAGFGPGGGCAGGGSAGHAMSATQFNCVEPSDGRGLSYGNAFLLPLIGGSGGGGHGGPGSQFSSADGGAGGGAIMIASSVSVRVNGTIRVNGGNPGGSGGAIRLVASTITGGRSLQALGNGGNFIDNTQGRSRLEAFQNTFTGSSFGVARATTLLPAPILLPTAPQPRLRIVPRRADPPGESPGRLRL